jgi:hypothetical protein
VVVGGDGKGTVTSDPKGITCNGKDKKDCDESYVVGTSVTLTATAAEGSSFKGWSGKDCGKVVISKEKTTCTATFSLKLTLFTLTITKTGTGTGTVTSKSDSGINCGLDCSDLYAGGTVVTLKATPDAGSTFVGWSGDPDCSDGVVAMGPNKGCTATFNLIQVAICPLSKGFWKNHPESWPVTALTLGSQSYGKAELLTLLNMLVKGDASLTLVQQLIVAKLNIANGSDPKPVSSTIKHAEGLLSGIGGKLPYKVDPSSAVGLAMVSDAKMLDDYNNRHLTPKCIAYDDNSDPDHKAHPEHYTHKHHEGHRDGDDHPDHVVHPKNYNHTHHDGHQDQDDESDIDHKDNPVHYNHAHHIGHKDGDKHPAHLEHPRSYEHKHHDGHRDRCDCDKDDESDLDHQDHPEHYTHKHHDGHKDGDTHSDHLDNPTRYDHQHHSGHRDHCDCETDDDSDPDHKAHPEHYNHRHHFGHRDGDDHPDHIKNPKSYNHSHHEGHRDDHCDDVDGGDD